MLLEMAIGDAYGIGFEFVKDSKHINDLSQYYQHPKYSNLTPGQYTDDTQRSLANVMVIAHKDYMSPFDYAQSYVEEFKASPRDGYSRGYQTFIESCNTGWDFINNIQAHKVSNGSIMGAAPLGYMEDVQQVRRAAMIQATLTHHWETIPWAQMIALMAHYFLYNVGPKDELINFLNIEVDYPSDKPMVYLNPDYTLSPIIRSSNKSLIKCDMTAKVTALHVLYAVLNFDNLADMLKHCIDVGGDTDSLAALAMAIGSSSNEIKNNLPIHLYDALENGPRGKDYIVTLDNVINNVYFPNTWIAQSLKK